ncbi:MAG: PKD domain-containing protein [Thermoplasmata archaeon]|nr:MAG: PKD domain-containing protein [Thermoplasmata archaeon]
MSQPDPDAGMARLFFEKVKLITVLMAKDFKGLHGLVRLIVFMFLFLIIFGILIGFAGDIIEQVGVPSWTGDILEGDGPGGVEALTAELEADVYIGKAPLTVNVTASVEHAEGKVKYKWFVDMQDEGAQPVSKDPGPFQWTFTDLHSHSIALVVEDDRGEIDPERVWFSIIDPADENMHAILLANETEGESPLDVAFSVRTHGGLGPYTYAWTFGDGTTSDQRSPVHTFEADGEEDFRVSVVVTDRTGNMTPEMETHINVREEESGSLGFTLLDFVYGFCVLVCVVMVPVAFTAAYRQELLRGTVRTLVCYPVGPLDITVAKLLFTFILCLPFTFIAFMIPVQGLEKDGGDFLTIFIVTFLLTIVTMTIGALAALAATRVTGRMWFRPHTVAFGAVLLAYVFTGRMMGLIGSFFAMFSNIDPDFFVDTFAPLIAISPYHLGGELLRAALGSTTDVNPAVLMIPILMLVVLGWLSTKVYPSIFEKE